MESVTGIGIIIGMCVLVLFIVLFRRKMEFVLNFLIRSLFGLVGIFFVNQLMIMEGINLEVGMNLFTLLTSGILGFPGVIMLYGVVACGLL